MSLLSRLLIPPLLGAAAVALAAQVSFDLPGSPVPVSLQSLAVLLVGAFLRPSAAGLALLVYLAAGALGLPVFADGQAGPSRLSGPTAGFLWSFPLVAHGVARGLRRAQGAWSQLGVFLAAHGVILLLGGVGLALAGRSTGRVVEVLAPLLPGAGLKSLLALGIHWGFRSHGASRSRRR